MAESAKVELPFHRNDVVRNRQQRLLTVLGTDELGRIHVKEERHSYAAGDLERVDATNLVRYRRALSLRRKR